MKANDIKKGMRIELRNGWLGTMVTNGKGNIRLANVEGYVTETGSVYAYDIVKAEVDGTWHLIEHTKSQRDTWAQAWTPSGWSRPARPGAPRI
jgi:hypothetical protein